MRKLVIPVLATSLLSFVQPADACRIVESLQAAEPSDGATGVPLNAVVFAQYALGPPIGGPAEEYSALGPEGELLPPETSMGLLMFRPEPGAPSAGGSVELILDPARQDVRTLQWSYGTEVDETPPSAPSILGVQVETQDGCLGVEETTTTVDVSADDDTVAIVVFDSEPVAAQLLSQGTTIRFASRASDRCYQAQALDAAGNASPLSARVCDPGGCTCIGAGGGSLIGLLGGALILLMVRCGRSLVRSSS